MARMQYKTKESSINYSSTRTDWENKGMEAKERERPRVQSNDLLLAA